jgi:DNA polymerase-3 subunit beta
VISRLLEGTFLDYKSAIPSKNSTELKIDTKTLLDCFERASLVIVERLKSPVRCIFDEDLIKVSCSTTLGKSFEQVEAKIEGEPLEIGFNNRFLLDALRASETDMVRLALNGANAPMKILPPEGDSFLFLVLPVRIKQEF